MACTLQDLKWIDTVAELGNISRAAVALGMTQPALSWSIRKLEEECGVPLFHRTPKGVVLTRAGETFLNRSRAIIRAWDSLNLGLREAEEAIQGRYTLGIYHTLAGFVLPKFVPQLFQQHSDLELKLVHDLSRNISKGVIQYVYDYGLVANPPSHPDLTIMPLYGDERKFWIADPASPLQDPSDPASVIVCNPESLQTEVLLRQAAQIGWYGSQRMLYSTDLAVIAQVAASGGGIGLLPGTIARQQSDRLVPLPNTPVFSDTIALIWRREAQKPRASRVIRDCIIEHLRD